MSGEIEGNGLDLDDLVTECESSIAESTNVRNSSGIFGGTEPSHGR
jgi:hypothetical protein